MCDPGTQQPGLTVANVHVALGNLGPSRPQALYLPAFQRQAGLERFLDFVVESCLFVVGNPRLCFLCCGFHEMPGL